MCCAAHAMQVQACGGIGQRPFLRAGAGNSDHIRTLRNEAPSSLAGVSHSRRLRLQESTPSSSSPYEGDNEEEEEKEEEEDNEEEATSLSTKRVHGKIKRFGFFQRDVSAKT